MSKKLNKGLFLAIIVIGLFGAGGFYLYQKNIEISIRTIQLSNDIEQAKKLIELTTVDAKLLNNNILSLQKEINNNSNNIDTIQNAVSEIKDLNSNPSLYIKLLNLENIINNADYKLQIDKDYDTAKQLLNNAERYLQNNKQMEIVNLRKSIIEKIKLLDEVEIPDTVKVYSVFDDIIKIIDNIVLTDFVLSKQSAVKTKVQINSEEVNLNAQNVSPWQSMLVQVKNDMLSLVKIRNLNSNEKGFDQLLDDRQLNALKLIFKLNIIDAKINLKNVNLVAYSGAINNLEADFNKYFMNNNDLLSNLISKLNEAKISNLPSSTPDLADLYKEIKRVQVIVNKS